MILENPAVGKTIAGAGGFRKFRMTDGLLKGLEEAVAVEHGELKGHVTTRTISRPASKWSKLQIKKLREEAVFASLLNEKPATVRAWEQGHRTPDGAAARLLEV